MKKFKSEIIISAVLMTGVVATSMFWLDTTTEGNEVDVQRVSTFDKYKKIHLLHQMDIEQEQASQSQAKLLDIEELAEEYNNKIPNITKEMLEKYKVPVIEKIESTQIPQTERKEQYLTYLDKLNNDAMNSNTNSVYEGDIVAQLNAYGIGCYAERSDRLSEVSKYDNIISVVIAKHQQTCKYRIPLNLIKSIIVNESGGNPNIDSYAKGLMQIENVNIGNFIEYGRKMYNQEWTSEDLLDPVKNIDYGVYIFAGNLNYYKGDYIKAVQAYNYSHYSLDKLIRTYGNDWLENRVHMAELNGRSSYGNPEYAERVFSVYRN